MRSQELVENLFIISLNFIGNDLMAFRAVERLYTSTKNLKILGQIAIVLDMDRQCLYGQEKMKNTVQFIEEGEKKDQDMVA